MIFALRTKSTIKASKKQLNICDIVLLKKRNSVILANSDDRLIGNLTCLKKYVAWTNIRCPILTKKIKAHYLKKQKKQLVLEKTKLTTMSLNSPYKGKPKGKTVGYLNEKEFELLLNRYLFRCKSKVL